MDYFKSNGAVKKLYIRLDPGDDVLKSVNDIIEKEGITNGAIVSGIGTLSDAVLHMVTTTSYPAIETFPEWKDTPLEVCSIQGIIANKEPHLHIVISDKDKAVGGHLEEGCITLYLCELVLEIDETIELRREKNEKNIFELKGN